MSRNIPISSALVDVEKLYKMNLNLSTPEEGEECLVQLDSLHKELIRAKQIQDDGNLAWEAILKELQGVPSFG